MKKPFISKTIRRNATLLTFVLFFGYLIFNFFLMLELNYYFVDNIDIRLKHEIGHVIPNIDLKSDTLKVQNGEDFQEYDMLHVTENSFYLQIYDLEGKIIFQSENVKIFNGSPSLIFDFEDEFYFVDEKVNYRGLRVCYTKIIENDKLYGYLQLATPQTGVNKAIENIVKFNLITLPLAFILFVIVSLIFTKLTLSPINKIIEISEEISATNLKKRIDYEADKDDVLGRLKATLNNLFDRLELQIHQISHFSDNASHQLMTPLTAINTELAYIRKRKHSINEYNESLEIIDEQTSEMIKIVKTLLILAKDCEDCGECKQVFNLKNLLNNEIREEFSTNNVTITIPQNIYINCNKEYFRMVLENLISNAIKYSPENSEVTVKVDEIDETAKIYIEDLGIGIADSEKDKVFDRFYRSNNVEDNGIKGYGLGLNLVESIVSRMEGSIEIKDNIPKGTIFVLTLPTIKLD